MTLTACPYPCHEGLNLMGAPVGGTWCGPSLPLHRLLVAHLPLPPAALAQAPLLGAMLPGLAAALLRGVRLPFTGGGLLYNYAGCDDQARRGTPGCCSRGTTCLSRTWHGMAFHIQPRHNLSFEDMAWHGISHSAAAQPVFRGLMRSRTCLPPTVICTDHRPSMSCHVMSCHVMSWHGMVWH